MAGDDDQRLIRRLWATFKAWNADPELWHTAYKDCVRATLVGLVLYTLAAAGGLVTREPLILALLVVVIVFVVGIPLGFIYELVAVIRAHRGVTHPSEGELRVMRSNALSLGIMSLFILVVVTAFAVSVAQGNFRW